MKTYKRTRIIASLAILSSLTLTGITFAATDTRPVTATSSISRSIGTRQMRSRTGTTTPMWNTKRQGNASTTPGFQFNKHTFASTTPAFDHRSGTSSPAVIGYVTAVNGNSFTVSRPGFTFHGKNKNASTTNQIATTTYTVNVTSGTVYLKDGKLDSLTDVTIGSFVAVVGSLDSNTHTVSAFGVHIINDRKKLTSSILPAVRTKIKKP